MPTLSGADSDSAPELSDLSDSAAVCGGGSGSGGESPAVDEEEVEDEEEMEEEEEGEEGVEDEEENDGGGEDEVEEELVEEEEMEDAVVEEEEEEVGDGDVEEVEGEESDDGDDDGEVEGADLSKEAEDTNMNIGSEEPGEGLETVSSTPERSKSNPPAERHSIDGTGGNPTTYDPSDPDYTDSGLQMVKDTLALAPDDARDAHGSGTNLALEDVREDDGSQAHLVYGSFVGAEDATLSWRNEIPMLNKDENSDDVEKEAKNLHTKTNLHTIKDFGLSSMQTPQRRPRSSSPGDTFESLSKRPEVICSFFASGWCIKGSSCRFLHQKEVKTSQQMEEIVAGTSRNGEPCDATGFKEGAERSKNSTSREPLHLSNNDSSLKSPFLLQRALVRGYGESHKLPKIHTDYNMLGAENISGENYRFDVQQSAVQTLAHKEYKEPFELKPHLDIVDQRYLADNDALPIKYQNEKKLQQEIPRGESLTGSSFLRGSSLVRNTLLPDYRTHLGGQPTLSSVYPYNSDQLAYDKRTDGHYIRNQQTYVPPREHGLSSLQSSSINNPLNSLQFSSSTRGSTFLSDEQFDAHKIPEFDRGNYGSRSASIPRNSSPYLSEITTQKNTPREFLSSTGRKTQSQDAWEPSVPFQPTFIGLTGGLPASGSQYAPLLDSIDPPNAGSSAVQTPQRANSQDASRQHINGYPSLPIHTTGYSTQNPLNSLSQSHERVLAKNAVTYGSSGYSNVMVAAPGLNMFDGGNSLPTEEKQHTSYMVEDANVSEVDPSGNLRNLDDKGKNIKEPKSLKFFRAVLIDFIKELVKPSWREGTLSKDAHKMIVKKAVEKVLGALQPHQIPPTIELANQYLSISQPKLLKLVEGYVEKYAKS